MASIYFLIKDRKVGPYTEEQVKQFLADGLISPDLPACPVGLTDWVPISKIVKSFFQTSPVTDSLPPPELLPPEQATQAAPTKHLVGGDEKDHKVECPHCHNTVIVNEGTGIYECDECGKDLEISLVCKRCGRKWEVEKWGETQCPFCVTPFDSWAGSEVTLFQPQMTPQMTRWKFVKGFLIFLGAITCLLLVLWGAGLGYVRYMSNMLAPSSQAYADESIRAIITTCSEAELIKRASPELHAITTQGQLDQLFIELKKVGSFQSYGGSQGKINLTINSEKGLLITAEYNASATFQYARADITIICLSR